MALIIYKITKIYKATILFLLLWPLFDGWHLWIDTFICFFTLAIYYFYNRGKWFSSGITIALALLFKQTFILLIPILMVYQYFYQKKQFSIKYIAKLSLPSFLLILYFLFQYSPQSFIYWTIVYNLTAYVGYALSYFFFPKWLILFLPGLILIKKHPLMFLFLLYSLTGFFTRPDLVHLQPAAPWLILFLYYFIDKYLNKMFIPFLGCLLILFIYKNYGNLTNYYPYFDPDTMSVINYLKTNVYPNSEIFLLGAQPHIYAFSQTIPAGKYFIYQLPWYMKNFQSVQLNVLKTNPPNLVVYDTSASVDEIPITAYASDLVSYTMQNYLQIQTIGNYQIYEKINQ